jgi:hypothetical protein
MMQIITAIISYVWLFLTLLLLFSIWRNSRITQKAQQVLIQAALHRAEQSAEASQKSAQAAMGASQAAQKAVETVYVLVQGKAT